LNIPRPDGRAILTLLRGLAAYQKTPVVIVSASKKATEEAPCLQLGANGYVQKSTDFAAYFGGIQATLRDWLGQTE
jgi:CheY-like chemotaxis protein